MKPRTALLLVLAATMGAVAGCSADANDSAVSPSTVVSTVTATPGGSPTTASPSDTSSTGLPGTRTPVNSAGAQPCRAADLSGTIANLGQGHAGPEFGTLALTNTGSTVCTVTGYPGVSFVGDGNGTQLGAAAARDGSKVVTVPIEPRGVATARFTIVDAGDIADCTPVRADGLRIYPPNDRNAIFLKTTSFTACRSADAQLLTIGTLR
ncbi:DUF4232 domain-containing protein [Williamsia sp.]|uniref:DUF4232 domain-containing protein n=1 Tax=Williamsia sp. TaxID=1872085 RepID=UPI001A210E91|nr:DUF4232 domain-containing protein [Williamsia sp.]MBJ7290219.1 DUF4232 domain-containing protein [Williamsia sp.]